uniref:Uncharacterized protein n=1 Tax=Archaeoglobus fulgidus TaxID=2234 RepID=A0A7C2S821_ARCFL
MFGGLRRKNETKISDAKAEEEILSELRNEEEEKEKQTALAEIQLLRSVRLKVSLVLEKERELLERIQSEGLMDELLSIAVERNLPADEIIRTARELVEKKEREKVILLEAKILRT